MALKRSAKLGAALLAGGSLAALLVLWSYREPIAQAQLDAYLAERGVPASYEIKAIEARRQRLENVRIGPADRPDLTADWVEIDVGPSLSGLSIKAVRAGGVRLHARYTGKKFSAGSVDRLLPASDGAPFRLPDVNLVLEDARMRLESPQGIFGVRLDGQGNARAGFEGRIAALSPAIRASGCSLQRLSAFGEVSIVGGRPNFSGPVRLSEARCGGTMLSRLDAVLTANSAEDFTNWRGKLNAQIQGIEGHRGAIGQTTLSAQFSGDARKTDIDYEAASQLRLQTGLHARDLRLFGQMILGQRGVLAKGEARIARVTAADDVARLKTWLSQANAAPVFGPIANKLNSAVQKLDQGVEARARFQLDAVDGDLRITASDLVLASYSGAVLSLPGRDAVQWDNAGLRLRGLARFGGGGLPSGEATLGGTFGRVRFQPYQAVGKNGSARLLFSPLDFRITPKGLGLTAVARVDGPLGSGRVTGLVLPLRMMPGHPPLQGCWPVRFGALAVQSLRLSSGRIALCVSESQIRALPAQMRGQWGGDPLSLAFAGAHYARKDGRTVIQGLSFQLKQGEKLTDLEVERLSAAADSRGWTGTFEGLSGQLANVPLRASDGTGRWSFAQSMLLLKGQAMVSDMAENLRFYPLQARDLELRLDASRVGAHARLTEPKSQRFISSVSLEHDLDTGQGGARFAVDALRFDEGLQPEDISPATLGVAAYVKGTIVGEGTVNWTKQSVSSHGRFSTPDLDFAAAFGPVTGFRAEMSFTDLLGFVTAPAQKVTIAGINPGIFVTDGAIQYRIRPGFQLEIEGGRWPFAGGLLILEPTVLDMANDAERRLTFRVEGLDAGKFIAAMEFDNISATGTFDGVLPMVFDANGGRIEGGQLVARSGGTVSYVGPVSNENLGLIGSFAFDALKSLRYSRLAIDLDGAIDGDVITRISLAGVNQAPVSTQRVRLPIKVLGASNLPFVFNVKVTAKFRQLFDMARSFNDPSLLINRLIPRLEPAPRDPLAPVPHVQPSDRQKRQ